MLFDLFILTDSFSDSKDVVLFKSCIDGKNRFQSSSRNFILEIFSFFALNFFLG